MAGAAYPTGTAHSAVPMVAYFRVYTNDLLARSAADLLLAPGFEVN